MHKLKVGIVGGGFMARTHTYAARAAGADVIAISSSSSERSAAVAQQLDIPQALDLDALVTEVDVVHVCSPNGLHAEHVRAAVKAGKHVVCEKPLAVDAGEAAELADEAESAGVCATVPFIYRFHPMVRQARTHVQEGGLGRLLTVRGTYLQDWMLDAEAFNWRVNPVMSGRSRAFGDIGSHLVDLAEFITGQRIVRVSALTSIAHQQRAGTPVTTEDAAALIVEFDDGALGNFMVSQVNAGRKNSLTLELAGTESSLAFDQEHPDELWVGGVRSASILARENDTLAPDAARLSRIPAGHPMGYLDAFVNFARDTYANIRGHRPEGLPSFNDGARANRIIDAVLCSAKSERWVDIAE